MKKNLLFVIIIALIVMLAIVLRTYKINAPIADWHSWRQVDTAAVARNFVQLGFDPLRPRYDDLSNIQSGKDNPQGYRMVEFPVYQIAAFLLYKIFPFISIEVSLRIVSIFSSVCTVVALAYLGKRISGYVAGVSAAFLYTVLPFSVFYGRSILPEPITIAFSMIAVVLAVVSKDKNKYVEFFLLLLSAVSASLALLSKPFALFLLLPIVFIVFKNFISSKYKRLYILIGFISFCVAVIPLYLWRQWILQFPEGIPASNWLFNEGNIRFKGAWFRWLFAERISKLILGQWGISLLVLGFIASYKKKEGIVFGLTAGSLLYMTIIARGNVQHDYYQQLVVPVLTLVSGIGLASLITQKSGLARLGRITLGITIIGFSLAFSWFDLRGFYWINRPEIVEAGNMANRILPKNAKVIASYNGDTTFLYQTGRQGWPIGFEIDKKIAQGATHYVTVSPTDEDGETKDLASRFRVLIRNDKFAIIDLTSPLTVK